MSFYPDRSKKAEEAFFSHKRLKSIHPPRISNSNNTICLKHFPVFLDELLIFEERLKVILSKINKVLTFYAS